MATFYSARDRPRGYNARSVSVSLSESFTMLRLSCALVLAFAVVAPLSADEPPAGFKSLFNGKDLTGWKANGNPKVWGAEEGILYVAGGGGGYLFTEKEFANFEFRCEYKMPKMGNCGVGMEIQLLDDANGKGLAERQHTGSICHVVPAKKANSKPFGEWNTIRIVADKRKVMVEHNGETLVDANLDDHVERLGKHTPASLAKRGTSASRATITALNFATST